MEARDALADIGWALRPRARRVVEAHVALAAVAAALVAGALAIAASTGAGSFLPAGSGAWFLVAVGLAAAHLVALTSGWWCDRHVLPAVLVPLSFGLVYLSPLTLLLVEAAAALLTQLWLRPHRPMRALVVTGVGVVGTAAAVVAFRTSAGEHLSSARTLAALAGAAAVATVVRVALMWFLERQADTGSSEGRPVVDLADVGEAALACVVGAGAVALTELDDVGVLFAVVGAAALMVASLVGARRQRRLAEVDRLLHLQRRIADAVHDEAGVVAGAASAVRNLLLADVVAVVAPERTVTVATATGGDEQLEQDVAETLLGQLQSAAMTGSIVAQPHEMESVRDAVGLRRDVSLHIVHAPMIDGGRTWNVVAIREGSTANPFTLAERKLLGEAGVVLGAGFATFARLDRYRREARYDELTGLSNRATLEDAIADRVDSSRATGRALGVLLVDLNGFKEVNDTLGHQTGDVVLAEIGARIASFREEVDALGRLGGDEFVLVISGDGIDERAAELSDRLARTISAPISHGDLVLDVGVSIGAARFPDHGDTPQELLRAADVAMYAGKAKGASFTAYEGNLDRHRSRRLGLATDLRAALRAEQLDVYYQPKVSFLDGALVGAEALIRWTHPTLRAIPAGEVVDIAEQAGLLCTVTDFVLDRTSELVRQLADMGCAVPIAVNLSERDVADPTLPQRLSRVLDGRGLEPGSISLEVTETALLTQEVEALGVLPQISEMGIAIAIDDFGTGFSSLSHLRRFPVDEIKIDMSFVERMVIRPNDSVIVRSIVDLGHSLGLRVVAEGVETNEAWGLLESFGADVAQGNYVMKAMDAETFVLWVPFWERHREQRGFMSRTTPTSADHSSPEHG